MSDTQSRYGLQLARLARKPRSEPEIGGLTEILFLPLLFHRYGMRPSDDPAALRGLIFAMARKHEPGFRRGRGRRPSKEMTDAQVRDWWLCAYIEYLSEARGESADWVISQIIMRRPAFRGVPIAGIRRGYQRIKKASAKGDREMVISFGELIAVHPQILDELQQRTVRK